MEATDTDVTVSIEDTGIGMDEEQISKLFQVNLNKTREGTEKEKGTDLGLMLCHELILQNKGKLSVVSQINHGSKFSFTLPKVA